jgi:hypothetical protein
MSKNNLKTMYMFSSEETKAIVKKYVQIEADRRECSLSKVIEELLLDAIYEQLPDSRAEITRIFENRYSFGYNRARKESD